MDLPADDVPIGLEIKRKKIKKQTEDDMVTDAKKVHKFRSLHDIKVSSSADYPGHIPSPVASFDDLLTSFPRFNRQLLNNVAELSFTTPTPVQSQAIPIMLRQRSLLACAPTGSGKTAAYLLPLLQSYWDQISTANADQQMQQDLTNSSLDGSHKIALHAVILAPTQELVRQIWSEASRLSRGLSEKHFIACLSRRHYADRGKPKKTMDKNGSYDKQCTKRRELRLPRSTKIVVATPYRMGFLLSLDPRTCPFDASNLNWLILDEYDKMLETDVTNLKSTSITKKRRIRSFRDQINPIFYTLGRIRMTNEQLNVAMFSATIPDEVVNWAQTELPGLLTPTVVNKQSGRFDLVQLCVGTRNSVVSTVKQELRYCATEEGKLLEMRYLLVRGLLYPCLIFMESRERAKDLVKEILLSDTNILANVISSDKTDAQRYAIIRAFREGQINVLVCTDLLGRGIDFKGVNMVVNYDLPPSKEEYIHRVGRTGRAGQQGRAVTLWTDADLPQLGDILKVMRRSGCTVDPELERLVADWHSCRSKLVLGKRKGKANCENLSTRVIISKRRGERRLVHDLISRQKRKGNQAEAIDMNTNDSKPIKWLRRWNPYRKPIRELPGARQNKQKQGEMTG